MNFADGEVLETDVILFSAGIRPQDELARQSGLEIGERGGIVSRTSNCQTSDEGYLRHRRMRPLERPYLWSGSPGLYSMAKVAGTHLNMLGGTDQNFLGADMSTKLKLLGVDVGSIGDAHGHDPRCHQLQIQLTMTHQKSTSASSSPKIRNTCWVRYWSAIAAEYDTLLQYALNGIELPAHPEGLILPVAGRWPLLRPGPGCTAGNRDYLLLPECHQRPDLLLHRRRLQPMSAW